MNENVLSDQFSDTDRTVIMGTLSEMSDAKIDRQEKCLSEIRTLEVSSLRVRDGRPF